MLTIPDKKQDKAASEGDQPGNPVYSEKDDIYSRAQKEPLSEETELHKEGHGDFPAMDRGLDVPGAELDDADEAIGEEDEENNFYSLAQHEQTDIEEGGSE